jgi:hypothetical protein
VDAPANQGRGLRPLGLGEILDRAVTLCVRNLPLFALIYLVFALPLSVVQYFAAHDQAKSFGALGEILKAQAAGKPYDPSAISKALGNGTGLNPWTGALLAFLFIFSPLPTAALIAAASALYLGTTIDFRSAYRVAFARWLPLLGINVLYLASGLLLYLAVFIVALFLVLGLYFITAQFRAVGIVLDVIVGLAATLAAIGFALVVTLSLQVSYFTCVVEHAPFITAFARGVRRVFVGVGLRRSLLVGAAYFAIVIGISFVTFAGQSIFLGLLGGVVGEISGTAYAALVGIATAAFTTAFIAIFYYDLRVREEGFDLQLATAAPGETLATQ